MAIGVASPLLAQDKPVAPAAKAEQPAGYKNLDVKRFEQMRGKTNVVVLDVRTKEEFDQGHIPGAVNLDVRSPDFMEKVKKLDPSKTYLVHCASGRRSVTACEKLGTNQFKGLFNLEGGFNAWKSSGNQPAK